MERASTADMLQLRGVEVVVIVVGRALVEVRVCVLSVPSITTVCCPVVECSLAPSDPCVVVETAATTEDLASGVWLFDTGVVGPVNQGGLVGPIVFTSAKFEGTSRGGNCRHVSRAPNGYLEIYLSQWDLI
jgi:hypothetical protein